MKMMNNKVAVVTGATGMLALALIRKLTAEGFLIYAVARPGSARLSRVPRTENITILECDLDSFDTLADIINVRCDAFYHFAWDGTYGASRNDMSLQTKNIQASVRAAEAAAKLGCSVFAGAGSQAEYGRKESTVSPDTPVTPETGYGAAKLCAGQMTRIICEGKGIRHIWFRIFSTYGPYDGRQTMIMSVINDLLDGVSPGCTEGVQLWDYLYCDDAAEAFYLAAEKGKSGSVYCIGSGKAVPLREYISAIGNAVDPDIPIGFGRIPYYPGQPMYLCADISSLKKDTGFEPKYSFEQGIAKTIEWVRDNR